MESELDPVGKVPTNGAARAPSQPVRNGNGDRLANGDPEAAEIDGLLQVEVRGNGEAQTNRTGTDRIWRRDVGPQQVVCWIKDELNEVVFWKFRLWMIVIFLVLLIVAVVLISLAVCAALHQDEDEAFDSSLFKVPRRFNGTFQMPNMVFSEELSDVSSNQSLALAAELQDKLSAAFRSSAALGRYFSAAEISAFRNGSVAADYRLSFLLPDDGEEQLRRFVVVRETVLGVLRQFLQEQETPTSDPGYIDPGSVLMFSSQ